MIFEQSSKNKKGMLFIFLFFLAAGVLVFLYSPVIFQEGNPCSQISGIIQLNFTNKDMVKLSSEEDKYVTKSRNGADIIKAFMKEKGYEFNEQMGSGYLFESPTEKDVVVIHKYYSKYYSLWKITGK